MSLEKFREREREYAYYGVSTATIKRKVNSCAEALINSGIENGSEKVSQIIPVEKSKPVLEKLRQACLSSLLSHHKEIDNVIEDAFKLPTGFPPEDEDTDEIKVLEEIQKLKLRLISLTQYRLELLGMERQLERGQQEKTDEAFPRTSYQDEAEGITQRLEIYKRSADELRSDLALARELFAQNSLPLEEGLEETLMNISIDDSGKDNIFV